MKYKIQQLLLLLIIVMSMARDLAPGEPPKKILTLDGGGLRGVIALQYLKKLENRTGKKISELFDLIVGTSTGGIMAVAFGILDMSVTEVEALYLDVGEKVFGQRSTLMSTFRNMRMILINSQYSHLIFEELLKDLIRVKLGHEDVRMSHSEAQKHAKVMLVAATSNTSPQFPYIFTNYDAPGNSIFTGRNNIQIWKAVRGTSAAPTYFNPIELDDGLKIGDGGTVANNPAKFALEELSSSFNTEMKDLDCLLSLGTGRTVWEDVEPTFFNFLTGIMPAMLVDSQGVDDELQRHPDGDNIYFRFNPQIPKTDLAETDRSKLANLKVSMALEINRHYAEFEEVLRILNH